MDALSSTEDCKIKNQYSSGDLLNFEACIAHSVEFLTLELCITKTQTPNACELWA